MKDDNGRLAAGVAVMAIGAALNGWSSETAAHALGLILIVFGVLVLATGFAKAK